MLPAETIKAYNEVRRTKDKSVLCHAPFTNLNFDQFGNITACCYNRKEVLGRIPQNTISEAWFGPAADNLRQHIRNNDLGGGCAVCRELIASKNFHGTKAFFYDEFADAPSATEKLKRLFGIKKAAYPKAFELELSNTCNLECTMCNGHFSSSIRKNREHLPQHQNPYDQAFVDELAAFMPYLTDMKFLGGEPFLIDIYYDIWDKIIEVKPKIKIHITTNGTVLNNRVKSILEKLPVGIVISVDSLDEATYERIRINAKHSRLMENIEFFKQLTRAKNTYLTFAVCPIITNWQTLPQMLEYTIAEGINLHFNVVWAPEHLSMQYLSKAKLQEVIDYLEANQHTGNDTYIAKNNLAVYREFIATLKQWVLEKEQMPLADLELFAAAGITAESFANKLPNNNPNTALLAATIACWYLRETQPSTDILTGLPCVEEVETLMQAATLPEALTQLRLKWGAPAFIEHYFSALQVLDNLINEIDGAVLAERIALVKPMLLASHKQEQIATNLGSAGALLQLRLLKQPSAKATVDIYENLFG